MEITSRKLFIALRYVVIAAVIFVKPVWVKLLLFMVIFGVIYMEYRVSTPEQREYLRNSYFGRSPLMFLTILILLIFLSYIMYPD